MLVFIFSLLTPFDSDVIVVAGTLTADVVVDGVERFPERDTLEIMRSAEIRLGGCVGNTGTALTRFGIPTAAVSRVGHDEWGDLIKRDVAGWAQRSHIPVDDDVQSSVTVVFVAGDGGRAFLHTPGALSRISKDQLLVDADVINSGTSAIHIGYALLLAGMSGRDIKDVLRQASNSGILTSLDVAWKPEADWRSIADILSQVDLFCPNREEAQAITGKHEPDAIAERLLDMGVRQAVAIKLGEQGAFLGDRGGHYQHVAPHDAGATVDTTGAGDVFIAAMLAGWHYGLDWPTSIQMAVIAGGMAVTAPGTSGVPDWAIIENAMNSASVTNNGKR